MPIPDHSSSLLFYFVKEVTRERRRVSRKPPCLIKPIRCKSFVWSGKIIKQRNHESSLSCKFLSLPCNPLPMTWIVIEIMILSLKMQYSSSKILISPPVSLFSCDTTFSTTVSLIPSFTFCLFSSLLSLLFSWSFWQTNNNSRDEGWEQYEKQRPRIRRPLEWKGREQQEKKGRTGREGRRETSWSLMSCETRQERILWKKRSKGMRRTKGERKVHTWVYIHEKSRRRRLQMKWKRTKKISWVTLLRGSCFVRQSHREKSLAFSFNLQTSFLFPLFHCSAYFFFLTPLFFFRQQYCQYFSRMIR